MHCIDSWYQDHQLINFTPKDAQFNPLAPQSITTKRFEHTNKPNLVLIHGFPTSSYDWASVWQPLSAHFSLLTLDMLGFGQSDKPKNAQYTLQQQADLFEAAFAHYGIKQCHILAHDYGDTVAQELLARHNQGQLSVTINSCILLNGGIFPEATKPVLVQKLLISPMGFWVAKLMSFKTFKRNFDHICTVPMTTTELQNHWQLMNHNQGKAVFHKLIRYMQQRKQYRSRWTQALTQFTPPMRFINGEDDPISGKFMAQRYQQLIDNADITLLDGIGHYPQIESPERVLNACLDFWSAHQIIVSK